MLTAECAGAPNFVLINYLTRSNGKRTLNEDVLPNSTWGY